MTDERLAGVAFTLVIVTTFGGAGLAKYMRARASRDPSLGVRTTTWDGSPATTIRPRTSFEVAGVMVGVYALGAAWLCSLAVRSGSELWLLVVILAGLASWLAVGAVVMGTRVVGDETVWLSPDGMRQRCLGVEQTVRWDDVVAFNHDVPGHSVTTRNPSQFRRIVPRLFVGGPARPIADPGGGYVMRLRLGGFDRHVLAADAIAHWVETPTDRHEIGTAEAVHRLVPGPALPPPDPR